MRTGGEYGNDTIAYFNGGLFDDAPTLDLTQDEIGQLILASTQDWGSVEPAIFGTLFERSLDPAKRSHIGAHYSGREDILLVIEPVIMDPLRAQWSATQDKITAALDRAVLGAYALTDSKGGWDEAWAEVFTDTGAGTALPKDHPLTARRAQVEEQILAALLRLNGARSKGK